MAPAAALSASREAVCPKKSITSLCVFGKGKKAPAQATAQALAAGPRVILLALYHGGQAFTPHKRTRLLHMPTKPKSKAPQSHPRSFFFSIPRPLFVVGMPRFVLVVVVVVVVVIIVIVIFRTVVHTTSCCALPGMVRVLASEAM